MGGSSTQKDNVIEDGSTPTMRTKKGSQSSGTSSSHGRNASGSNFYQLTSSSNGSGGASGGNNHLHHQSRQFRKDSASMSSTSSQFQQSQMMQTSGSHLFACPNSVGMSQYVGASSLRHASPQFTFSKSDRFQGLKLLESGSNSAQSSSSQNIVLPWTGSPKTCTFGFGTKNFFPQHVMRNAREFPSPDTYNLNSDRESKKEVNVKAQHSHAASLENRGRTTGLSHSHSSSTNSSSAGQHHSTTAKCSFGISYNYYAKTYIPGYKMQCTEVAKELPGAGQYRVEKEPGENKLKFSLFGKPRDPVVKDDQPAANHYHPSYLLEENKRYSNLTFGKGNKFDFTKNARNGIPGPGTYKLPSPFDKFDPSSPSAQFRSQRSLRRTAFI